LFNLLDNSIRFSDVNGKIEIKGVLQKGQEIAISIRDFGEGIEKDELPHIFERTYRVEKSRNKQYGGAGLGLAIVKTIVERHNGTITVSSVLGQGSTFTIVIPIH
jgi:two-component system sensor histidine kinase SaeS